MGGLWESRWVSAWLPMDICVDGLSGLVDIRVIVGERGAFFRMIGAWLSV